MTQPQAHARQWLRGLAVTGALFAAAVSSIATSRVNAPRIVESSREGALTLNAANPEAKIQLKVSYDPSHLSKKVANNVSSSNRDSLILVSVPLAEGSTLPEDVEMRLIPDNPPEGWSTDIGKTVTDPSGKSFLQAQFPLLV